NANVTVDANHLAVEIEQRPPRIAAYQCAVGMHDALACAQHSAETDDGTPARTVPAGVTDGDAPLALLDFTRLAHLDVRPFALVGDLDESAVGAEIRSERLGSDAAAIGQHDCAIAIRLTGDVPGSKNVTVLGDDDAASRRRAYAYSDGARTDFFHHHAHLLLD